MTIVFYAGIVVALIGFAGILLFIRRVRKLKHTDTGDAAFQAELRALVALNTGAVGLAFLGLAIAVVGLIME
jgi:hypothetical protein